MSLGFLWWCGYVLSSLASIILRSPSKCKTQTCKAICNLNLAVLCTFGIRSCKKRDRTYTQIQIHKETYPQDSSGLCSNFLPTKLKRDRPTALLICYLDRLSNTQIFKMSTYTVLKTHTLGLLSPLSFAAKLGACNVINYAGQPNYGTFLLRHDVKWSN